MGSDVPVGVAGPAWWGIRPLLPHSCCPAAVEASLGHLLAGVTTQVVHSFRVMLSGLSTGTGTAIDTFEHVFDHEGVSLPSRASAAHRSGPADSVVVEQLRRRVQRMQGGPGRQPVATHPAFAGSLQLRTGASYGVDSLGLALALVVEASRAGSWIGMIGVDDLGVEAAAELGIELSRTVLVPDPGEHWLEAVAALIDTVGVVVLRQPVRIDERTAGLVEARLRKRSAVLVVHGEWPRCEARLVVEQVRWLGVGRGFGRLRQRQVTVTVRRGDARTTHVPLWYPGAGAPLARLTEAEPLADVRPTADAIGACDRSEQPLALVEGA